MPATVHQWQPYHLNNYLDGIDALTAFRRFGLDASLAMLPVVETESPDWRRESTVRDAGDGRALENVRITTPGGTLTYAIERSPVTDWIAEHAIKQPEDVDLLDKYLPVPKLDREALRREYDRLGDDGIMRGFVIGHQGGCWQDACEYVGLERLILATYDDPDWVHHLLRILQKKKLQFIEESLPSAAYDLIETGGGSASSTCISPDIHRDFCLPYDREQHDALHRLGFQVVYHTCGGMMPILDLIVENDCDASETLTPVGMGGDADHAEIKRRIGDRVALIGGLNQFQVLDTGTPEQIRAEVSRLFETLGPGGGYVCSPSDHFFETPPGNLEIYAAAARECTYD